MATQPKRRIMRDFVISEISAVDSPAQKGALVALLKRDDSGETFTKVSAPAPKSDISKQNITPKGPPPEVVAEFAAGLDKVLPVAKDDKPEGFSRLEDAIETLIKRGSSRTAAMAEARRRFPNLFEKYQGRPPSKPPASAMAKAVTAFAELVASIAREDKIGKSAAMSQARKRHPEVFAAAYPRT